MRSRLPISAIALAAACASGSTATGAGGATATPAGAPAGASARPTRVLMANLTSTGTTSSRMSGTVTLTRLDANTYSVAMDLRGAPPNKQVPWAIRPGACGDQTPDSEIGGRGAYGAIQTENDGMAHVNTRVRVQLPDQTLHVDVMQSISQRDVILACGPLAGR
ncbi:MAG: hypothetical protein ACREPM_10870 [Gemmatimonadaceae bacterium]